MRADRLLSILMYMQTRGRTTTVRLAREFEVSQRTIIRDLYALRVAGFPVYTERGPHGGCYLHEEYRNTLTQLTADEIAALFLSSIRKPLEDLGLSKPLRAALLKLTAAIPAPRQAARSRVAERVLIDSAPWRGHVERSDHLSLLHRAAMEDRWVRVAFARPFNVVTRRRIAPYGLVAKAGAWFCVWAGEDSGLRVDRVSRVMEATIETEYFDRPADFNLDAFWTGWRERQEGAGPTFGVRIRVREWALPHLRDVLGERRGVFPDMERKSQDWIEVDLAFSYLDEARRKLLALGGAIEVIHPKALRASIADYARQIGAVYAGDGEEVGSE